MFCHVRIRFVATERMDSNCPAQLVHRHIRLRRKGIRLEARIFILDPAMVMRKILDFTGKIIYKIVSWFEPEYGLYTFDSDKPIQSGFLFAFHRRFREYFPIPMLIFFIMLIDYLKYPSLNPQVYEIFFNFIGGVILARGVVVGEWGFGYRIGKHKAFYIEELQDVDLDLGKLVILAHNSVDGL